MTKFQLMLTSLIAVIPGAFLVVLLVMAMLSYSEHMSIVAYVVIGLTLVASVLTVLTPAGIMLGGNRKAAAPNAKAKDQPKQDTGDEIAAMDDDIALDEDAEEPSEILDDDAVLEETSAFHMDEGETEFGAAMIDDDTEPVEEFESMEIGDDDLEIDDFDEIEEEPKPKKKKR